jgi:two-component system response regulator HupR/HoxA
MDFKWPGNMRELQNEVERLVVLAGDDKNITPDLISERITDQVDGPAPVGNLRGINTKGHFKSCT